VCGRFALFTVDDALAEYWELDEIPAAARALLAQRAWPVGWGVNDPRRDNRELIEFQSGAG
jgi:hypothetical protein